MQINGQNFTIGADPEVFAGKDGKLVPAHTLIPGDKMNPHRVDKGAVQVDGLALEFNIDPASSFEEFNNNLSVVSKTLLEMIGDHEFLTTPSVFFDEDFLETVPAKHLILGCSADYNAWTMEEQQPPNAQAPMRTAGGHVHVGWTDVEECFEPSHYDTCGRLARMMDETLGAFSILWDKDDQRRALYGRAGSFRPTSYGMEYRTLSNAWLFDPKLIRFVFDGVVEAIEKMFEGGYEPSSHVQDVINTSKRGDDWLLSSPKCQLIGV